MQLIGQLQNLPPRLQVVFEAFSDGALGWSAQPVAALASSPKRLGNGVVQRAVANVLEASDQPMRVVAIRTAVEALLGQAVSYESVSWCLRMGSRGHKPRFERASYYCYRLRGQ
jgi:hypothetical protein